MNLAVWRLEPWAAAQIVGPNPSPKTCLAALSASLPQQIPANEGLNCDSHLG